jgi:septum site-determining protein MinD
MSKVYTITSGKGGVGKTTIAANLAVSLSRMRKKTIVVDADMAVGSIATIFGLDQTPVTLHELLAGTGSLEKAIYSTQGVDVLPSGSTVAGFLKTDPKKLEGVVDKLTKTYDFVIIDGPPGLSKYSLAPLKNADEVLLVVTPDLPALQATAKLLSVITAVEAKVGGVVVNRFKKHSFFARLAGAKEIMMKNEDIERRLMAKIIGIIPEDPAVIESIGAKKSVVVYRPESPASKAISALAKKLIQEVKNTERAKS